MAYCSPFLGVFRAKIEKHLSLALCNTTRITVPPVHCYECLWGVTVQQRIQDIRGLSEWILVWSVDRAEWDLTLALIRPLGCACKGAHCLPALCFSKRESGEGLSLSSVEHKRGESLNEEEKIWQHGRDVTERCSEGPMSNTKTWHFIWWSDVFILSHQSMIAQCGANQVVISGSEAISVCTIFVSLPLNKHKLRKGPTCFSSRLMWHTQLIG